MRKEGMVEEKERTKVRRRETNRKKTKRKKRG